MDNEYLWDRSGEPDPEIERLERLLAAYRGGRTSQPRTGRRVPALAAAVAACLVLTASAVLVLGPWKGVPPQSVWALEMNGAGALRPRVGDSIETGRTDAARLSAESVGEVRLLPESRLKIVRSNGREERLQLSRGALHALIWAPPRRFVVDTPSAATVDLGCEYDLQVAADGSGLLQVRRGWVAFQAGKVESFIPEGAACRTTRRTGPGLPYFEDAAPEFRAAAAAFDLNAMLATARARDALTLWHVLRRAPADSRAQVASKLASLVPGADAGRLARLDPAAVEECWNALGLGDTGWWRTWKRVW